MTKININIETINKAPEEYKRKALLEKVNDYIMVCESDEDSEYHWKYLACIYKKLCEMQKVPEHLDMVRACLDEFFSKNNKYASDSNYLQLEGKDMFKYRDKL